LEEPASAARKVCSLSSARAIRGAADGSGAAGGDGAAEALPMLPAGHWALGIAGTLGAP